MCTANRAIGVFFVSMLGGFAALMLAPTGSGRAQTLLPESDTSALVPRPLRTLSNQVGQFQSDMSEKGLNGTQFEQACANVAAKHLTSRDVQSIGASLGLSADQVAQLQECAERTDAAGGPGGATSTRAPAGAVPKPGVSASSTSLSQPPSLIEDRFHQLETPYKLLTGPRTNSLIQFGYSLFSSPVSTFAPVANVPVSNDYILGPGDGLNVLLWGRVNRTLNLQVQRDGTVLIPEIGPMEVAGLTFEQAKKLIESRAGQITGVHVDVTMGQIRSIEVFVLGQVNHPGLYLVSALSHVSNALVAAGGVSKVGSLRNIELRRGNRAFQLIDLYTVLLHGNTSADVRLETRDVIFVPTIGPVVGVVGDVKSPAIYEVKGPESLSSVLRMAGGVTAFGYGQRIQVERVNNHTRRVALDLNLQKARAVGFTLKDGDLIKVFTVLPRVQDVVRLNGNVNQPGSYQWYAGMHVSDLIREGQGVADHTFFHYALLRRAEGPERKVHFIPVNLGDALRSDARADIVLERDDSLTVYSDHELQEVPTVTVRGAVRKPGSYPLTDAMKVSDLIYEAGGLKDGAYRQHAEVARTQVVNGSRASFTYISVDLQSALAQGPGDLPLIRGDELFVQQASNWRNPWEVSLEGEVARPGPYVIREGERLASVLERAGGLRADAYLPAAIIIRQSVRKTEQERLDDSRRRLETQAARLSLMPTRAGTNPASQESLQMIQRLLADAQAQQAVGRLVLHLASLKDLPRSHDNLVLQDGDRVIVPKQPASVAVLGEVYNPSAIIYEPGRTARDYLARAGGPTEWADEDHIYVIKANGEIITDESIRNSGRGALFPLLSAMSGGLMDVRLERGDTIYVPEQLVYVDKLQMTGAVTQIIANTATSLAVLGLLGAGL